MTPAILLRRQFDKAAKKPMAHLIRSGEIYLYSRRVPAAVRKADPSQPDAVRRSTGTHYPHEAVALARQWADADEASWLKIVSGKGDGPWLTALREDRETTLDRAQEVIERRADQMRVRGQLEAARSPHDFPDELRTDPAARPAIHAVYAARGKVMTWTEAWEAFETRSNLSRKTRLTYANSCSQFDKAGLPGPHEITREKAREYLKGRAQAVTRSTVNIDMAAATAVLSDLFDDEARAKLFRNHKLRFTKEPAQRTPLTRDDIRAMLKAGAVSEHLGLFMRLALGTGARRNEAYYGTLDLDRMVLGVTREVTKTKAGVREIPLSARLAPVAQAWLQLRQAKATPTVRALQDAFATARDAAGLPDSKTLHSCRHAFITELAKAGVPEDRRKALAGHSKAGNTHAGYVHLSADDLRDDVERVDFETGLEWPRMSAQGA